MLTWPLELRTKRGGKPISLVRYNGSSHVHGEIRYDYHIHQAAANAVESGRKIDSHANQTDRYKTVEGALACLIEDCQVSGIDAKHDGQDLLDLFDGT